jgi:hypothetical protein
LRQAVRSSQSAPILRRLRAALEIIRPRHLPQSAMGAAIRNALDAWEQLLVHVRDA